jgi:hypothetical protein
MCRLALVTLLALAVSAPAALADTVTGAALTGSSPYRALVEVNAHSGPGGEQANGSVRIDICPLGPCSTRASQWGGSVSCLNVQGNRAVIGLYGTVVDVAFTGLVRLRGFLEVVDNGSPGVGKDTLTFESHSVEVFFNPSADVPLTACPASLAPNTALGISGPLPAPPSATDPLYAAWSDIAQDFVVTDTHPLPTSKDQCKNGGWRNYPGFKNQGDCVSFVAA